MTQKYCYNLVLHPHQSTNRNNLHNLSRCHLFISHAIDLPTDVHAGETDRDRDRDQGLDLLPAIHMRIVSISLPHSHKTKNVKKTPECPLLAERYYNCGRKGHIRRQCRERRTKRRQRPIVNNFIFKGEVYRAQFGHQ